MRWATAVMKQTAYSEGVDIHYRRSPGVRTILCSLCLFLMTAVSFAQVGTQASLTGTVTDTSGAAVAGAQLTITNLATHESTQTTSDGRGNFQILALPQGLYKASVKAPGFSSWEIARVQLTVGDQSRLAPVLRVGASTETVRVQGTSSLMQTESPTLETVVQMQQIRELPLDTRNPLALVALVPGMVYQGTTVGSFRDTFVQGQGMRNYKTNFQLDGIASNASSSEGGSAVPNVDAVEEFNVQTVDSGAEAGRDPSQVLAVTKSGTDQFHGTAFEFNQNDIFSARNAFALQKNRVRYNQFGGTAGGPIVRGKTFFFGSYQQTVIGNDAVINEPAITTEMEAGNFSALSTPITNPYTKQAFQDNKIPTSMIDSAAKYFLPLFVTANSPDGFFKALGKAPNTTYEYLGRIDHQITPSQHIYGRFEYVHEPISVLGYYPTYVSSTTTNEPSFGANYTWAVSSKTLLTFTGGFMRDGFAYTNPLLGKQNDSVLAGIEGIPSAGREAWIGPPDIYITGYQGVSLSGGGYGAPGKQSGGEYDGKGSVTHVAGSHALEIGGEYFNRTTYGEHGSAAPRGVFDFGNLYSGNGFSDYLLGLTSSSQLNDPLGTFGQTLDPIMAGYATDTWKVRSNLTVKAGVRYERFLEHKCFANICSLWDPETAKTVVATDAQGNPNLNHYPTTKSLAESTSGLWETSVAAGYPRGLYEANGQWEPRVGVTFRPFKSDFVLRGGYGIYYNIFTGNRDASEINMPLWTVYSQNYSLNTLQKWETVWAAGPNGASLFSVYSPLVNTQPTKTQEWNVSLQTALPFSSALTLSYVGTNVSNESSWTQLNAATVGFHSNLQNDLPNPLYSNITVTANQGKNWYNGLQAKWERRYENGLAFTAAYSWSKTMAQNLGDCETCSLLPYSSSAYNRHVATFAYPQVEAATVVWQIPYGHGRMHGSNSNGLINAVLGGWQLSGIQTAHAGGPLEITQSNGNLGNGYSSRTNLTGNPHISKKSAREWFKTSAFSAAPLYTFGNSGVGAVSAPRGFQLNSGVFKNINVSDTRYFQFRWETYNITNHVNYNNPDTNLEDSDFGQITSSGEARYMQFGLKFVF
jgi:hypothetical protein